MAVFLFATAAVVLGLVSLVAGHVPWVMGRTKTPRASEMSR
jgi:hypothetical protein